MQKNKIIKISFVLLFILSNAVAQKIIIGAKGGYDLITKSAKYYVSGDVALYKGMSGGIAFDYFPNQKKSGKVGLTNLTVSNTGETAKYTSSAAVEMISIFYKYYVGNAHSETKWPLENAYAGMGLAYGFGSKKYTITESYDHSLYASPFKDLKISQPFIGFCGGYELKLVPTLFLDFDFDLYGAIAKKDADMFAEDRLRSTFAVNIGMRYALFNIEDE